jgi:hypothetical protein
MSRFAPPSTPQLDGDAEQVRRVLTDKVAELQRAVAAMPEVIANVVLTDGALTLIPHKLGREPRWVRESCVRGASTTGRVEEIRSGGYDRKRYVALQATGYGAPITVDVAVM